MTVTHLEFSFLDTARSPARSIGAENSAQIEMVMTRLDVEPEAVRAASALLSDSERQRAGRFVFDCDRRRFTVARSRLRRLLGERLDMRPSDVELVYGKRGKPELARRHADADIRFNVAHTDDVAVFAFSSGRDIGVDIEAVRCLRDAEDIAERFFSRREYASYIALDRCDKPLGFFSCWTRKEAFVKALGDGLYHPLDSFDVSLAPDQPAEILSCQNITGDACGWSLHSFSPDPGLVGAVVVRSCVEPREAEFQRKRERERPAFFRGFK